MRRQACRDVGSIHSASALYSSASLSDQQLHSQDRQELPDGATSAFGDRPSHAPGAHALCRQSCRRAIHSYVGTHLRPLRTHGVISNLRQAIARAGRRCKVADKTRRQRLGAKFPLGCIPIKLPICNLPAERQPLLNITHSKGPVAEGRPICIVDGPFNPSGLWRYAAE